MDVSAAQADVPVSALENGPGVGYTCGELVEVLQGPPADEAGGRAMGLRSRHMLMYYFLLLSKRKAFHMT